MVTASASVELEHKWDRGETIGIAWRKLHRHGCDNPATWCASRIAHLDHLQERTPEGVRDCNCYTLGYRFAVRGKAAVAVCMHKCALWGGWRARPQWHSWVWEHSRCELQLIFWRIIGIIPPSRMSKRSFKWKESGMRSRVISDGSTNSDWAYWWKRGTSVRSKNLLLWNIFISRS